MGQPRARRPLQHGGDWGRHCRPRHGGGRCDSRREGCAGRARADGRRLPELRMRAVEGADPIGASRRVGSRRGPLRRRSARRRAREFSGRHGADAQAARRAEPDRLGQSVPRPRRRRVHRRRTFRRARLCRGRRPAAEIQESRDHYRCARRVAADSGSGRRRLPDQRDGFLADRIAAANRRDWRRADRMRAGADLRALRRAGHAARSRAANPDSRGSRRRRTGRARDRPRRRGNHHGLQNFRRRSARRAKK